MFDMWIDAEDSIPFLMGSLAGLLQRPLSVAAAVAIASVSSDIPDKFAHPKLSEPLPSDCSNELDSWVSRISLSNISDCDSLESNIHQNHTTGVQMAFPFTPKKLFNPIFSSIVDVAPAIHTLYQYARIAKPRQSSSYAHSLPSSHFPHSEVMYKWHLPDPHTIEKVSDGSLCASEKSQTVIVLLGWLGAKQKQLKKYADWYTSKGFNVITFTYPMGNILRCYKVGGDAEKNLELLANHLAEWVTDEHGKKLVFHTFSNTGWLT